MSSKMEDDDGKGKKAVTKKDKRRAEKKEERDKWQHEMAMLDDARMLRCKKIYYNSLLTNLPAEPSCVYPVCVDGRDGIFIPQAPVADVIMPDCPPSSQARVHVYNDAIQQGAGTAMTLLADEMSSIQQMKPAAPLDALIIAAYCKYHAIAAAVALAVTCTDIQKGYGVRVSGLSPSSTTRDAVEMAFFAHGNLLRTIVESDASFTFYYVDEHDAQTAARKMNGRQWRNDVLRVELV
eukprot:TRINITY_DN15218_c0_g1_i2.p1 TRINITY_DN15218_c0_g1~~TRINITY_DN15218_c0_g1_i2.p1  ORF type:complete len:237 (+),score=81.07 TRINITY_DN15218_c0_g1_i2:602-1312(+)